MTTAIRNETQSLDAEIFKRPIDAGVGIGHVHLKVADIQRGLDFYCGVLGFEIIQRYGTQAAFISAGGYHHHIALNTWESKGGSPPARGTTGLFHLAIAGRCSAAAYRGRHSARRRIGPWSEPSVVSARPRPERR
jgi:catechol-2,3-dioxygenase